MANKKSSRSFSIGDENKEKLASLLSEPESREQTPRKKSWAKRERRAEEALKRSAQRIEDGLTVSRKKSDWKLGGGAGKSKRYS